MDKCDSMRKSQHSFCRNYDSNLSKFSDTGQRQTDFWTKDSQKNLSCSSLQEWFPTLTTCWRIRNRRWENTLSLFSPQESSQELSLLPFFSMDIQFKRWQTERWYEVVGNMKYSDTRAWTSCKAQWNKLIILSKQASKSTTLI